MSNYLFQSIRCLECEQELSSATLFPGKCPACGSAWLDARYDINSLAENWPEILTKRPTNMWRYRELLPFPKGFHPVSMGEGWTPLTRAESLEAETGISEVWIKDERQQPTSSFKDRQASAAISALKAEGVEELVLASTGNAAAAYAAFCARAGIKLWVFLTSSVPAEKMRELALYGAEVIKITGTYDMAKSIAADFAARRNIHIDTGAKAIPDKESMKTVAFEIVEQLGWRAPDWYIQAVSGGLGPIGVLKGFEELFAAGLIDKVPKIGIVQVDGCAPIVRSWERGLEEAEPVTPDTLITVLSTGSPGFAYKILKQANEKYGGMMVAVSDGEAFRAMRKLARSEGFSVEPATSVAFAGFEKMSALKHIKSDEVVVINCSGHTFSAEKHALEDKYTFDLKFDIGEDNKRSKEGLVIALEQLDEQVTTIVIIDDNPNDSRLIKRLLQRYKHYRIFEANNGRDGIDLVRQRKPDLVMLDLTLPEMDGFTILEELKSDKRTKDIPVMIVSGRDLSPDQEIVLSGNVQSVWQKGNFSNNDFINHIVGVLGADEFQPPDPDSNPAPMLEYDRIIRQPAGEESPIILVVDDNRWDARLMRRLLNSREHFKVIEAHTTSEAKNLIQISKPNLIILDLLLPGGSGEDLLANLREEIETENIPVIVLTAKDLEPESRAQLASQADSIWSKEVLDHRSLLAHVETILNR